MFEPNTELSVLNVGDRLWNGALVTPAFAKAYNDYSAKVAQFERAEMPSSDIERLRNGRHNLLAAFCENNDPKKLESEKC